MSEEMRQLPRAGTFHEHLAHYQKELEAEIGHAQQRRVVGDLLAVDAAALALERVTDAMAWLELAFDTLGSQGGRLPQHWTTLRGVRDGLANIVDNL